MKPSRATKMSPSAACGAQVQRRFVMLAENKRFAVTSAVLCIKYRGRGRLNKIFLRIQMVNAKPDFMKPSLAPMEGVTTFPMRLWFWLVSAPERLATPFLRATPTFPTKEIPIDFAPELGRLRGLLPYELIPQIMTAEAEDFIRSARLFADAYGHIELNAGCPSPNCVGKGAGSSLLKDPEAFGEMMQDIATVLGRERFAVKIRTGFDSPTEFPQLLAVLHAAPVKHLTVHGRSRPQGYKGRADWSLIDFAGQSLTCPVIASGDIASAAGLAEKRAQFPHISGAIIGRGALRNPWIFEEIRTGRSQQVSRQAVVYALASFGLLQDLAQTNLDRLFGLARDGVFTDPCLRDEDKWRRLYTTLSRATFGKVIYPEERGFSETYILERRTAGRLKLLWNYIRSSLPSEFFVPEVMRSSSPASLIQAINKLFRNESPVSLTYQPDLDWIYNGEKNERQAAAQRERIQQAAELC